MFIFWGRKILRKKLGYVADYCPVCRGPKVFRLNSVKSHGHLYYISLGSGQLLGHEMACQECGTAFEVDPHRYASVAKKPLAVDELTRLTFPNLAEVLQERIAIDRKVMTDPFSLTREQRQEQIARSFLFLSPKVEKRFASTQLDKEIGFAFLATVGLVSLAVYLADRLMPGDPDLLIAGAFVFGLLLITVQFAKAGRRYLRREIIPTLARTLGPLRPSEEELTAVLQQLRQMGHKVGKKMKLADLMPALQAVQFGQR